MQVVQERKIAMGASGSICLHAVVRHRHSVPSRNIAFSLINSVRKRAMSARMFRKQNSTSSKTVPGLAPTISAIDQQFRHLVSPV
jgi:hypothetical protein